MRKILIRHGKTKGNIEKRYIGRTDEPLIDNIAIEKKYPPVDMVISSPMKRCLMTARLIYPEQKILISDKLRETDFGEFENKTYEELKNNKKYIEWISSNGMTACPSGESREDLSKRCIEEYNRIISGSDCGSTAFIIHGGCIMAIMEYIYGGNFYDYYVDNLGGFIINENGKWTKI